MEHKVDAFIAHHRDRGVWPVDDERFRQIITQLRANRPIIAKLLAQDPGVLDIELPRIPQPTFLERCAAIREALEANGGRPLTKRDRHGDAQLPVGTWLHQMKNRNKSKRSGQEIAAFKSIEQDFPNAFYGKDEDAMFTIQRFVDDGGDFAKLHTLPLISSEEPFDVVKKTWAAARWLKRKRADADTSEAVKTWISERDALYADNGGSSCSFCHTIHDAFGDHRCASDTPLTCCAAEWPIDSSRA